MIDAIFNFRSAQIVMETRHNISDSRQFIAVVGDNAYMGTIKLNERSWDKYDFEFNFSKRKNDVNYRIALILSKYYKVYGSKLRTEF